jgi:hypothetical protein
MKTKLFTFFASALLSAGAYAQCTVDPNNTDFFNPSPDSVPCATQGVAYDETLQMFIPASVDLQDYVPTLPIPYTLNVDSVVLNTITGLPAGLTWSSTPTGTVFSGGTNLCGRTQGTTNATAGIYPITFEGLIYLSGAPFQGVFDGDTTISVALLIESQYGQSTFDLQVIAPGRLCGDTTTIIDTTTVGIRSINADLEVAVSVMPNPSNGIFNVQINTAKQITGEILVTDIIGKQMYAQPVNTLGNYITTINLNKLPKGLYTLQLRTSNGFTVKSILIE